MFFKVVSYVRCIFGDPYTNFKGSLAHNLVLASLSPKAPSSSVFDRNLDRNGVPGRHFGPFRLLPMARCEFCAGSRNPLVFEPARSLLFWPGANFALARATLGLSDRSRCFVTSSYLRLAELLNVNLWKNLWKL